MKTCVKLIAAVVVAACMVSFAGCLSSSKSSVDENKTTTVNLYVNAPTDATGRAAYALMSIVDRDFSDPLTFTFTGTPGAAAVKPVTSYYAHCQLICKNIDAVNTSGTKATLKFNSKKDGSGYALDFSDSKQILRSLLIMAAYDLTDVYAIYTY